MKKVIPLAVILITAFFSLYLKDRNDRKTPIDTESRGIFISYLEYLKYFEGKDNVSIKKEIEKMINNIDKYHFNCIYLHIRPFSDSTYESSIFPPSHTISGHQGEFKIDVLKYFIEFAHNKNIKVQAWINPYRISNNSDISFLSEDNPAYKWLNTNKVRVVEGNGIYYNPANNEVIKLITDGVYEVVSNYDVDGVLFDDYFYPNDLLIDRVEYSEVENIMSLKDFRLSKVNKLISSVYKVIKKYDPTIEFGVSPDGNIDNDYNLHYADIKKWLTVDGYIDYIMPQLYYGFYHGTKPFIRTLNEWNGLITNDVKLIVALALYKSGEIDEYAKTGKNEWIENSNLIKTQIQVSRRISNYSGYAIFRYDYLFKTDKNVNLQLENKAYLSLFD